MVSGTKHYPRLPRSAEIDLEETLQSMYVNMVLKYTLWGNLVYIIIDTLVN